LSQHTPLGAGAEFDAIRGLLARWGANAQGIGDDAALLDVPPGHRLVVSTDTSIENVHFRREWLTPEEIGWRSTMAALSDLAAMGATPLGILTALSVPPSWRAELAALADGIGAAAHAARCTIVGGDTNAGTELSLAVTVLGFASAPLARCGARPGDALWVTGALGGPLLALRALLAGQEPPSAARVRFARPIARLAAGVWLADRGCRAAIDVSDGVVADARHLAAASGATLTIALDALPLFEGANATDAGSSGEEYELLVAGPPTLDAAEFERAVGVRLTRIGDVGAGTPGVIVTHGKARVEFGGGHDHFSR
jgi:thiamine-monophosphate kinase